MSLVFEDQGVSSLLNTGKPSLQFKSEFGNKEFMI